MKCETPQEALEILAEHLETAPKGPRHICVLDRGWIFVGDLLMEGSECTLSRAQNIRRFKKVGFGGLTKGAKHAEAILDKCSAPIKFRRDAMIFCVPVGEDWDE